MKKYINLNKRKTWGIFCKRKIISKHINFLLAQDYVSKLFKENKIDNTYEIKPIT